jgi:perosamine synthetase
MEYKVSQLEPYVGKEELENLKKVIDEKWLTEGVFSIEFLEIIKEFTHAKHAVLANNGTLALFLGLLSLDVDKGDEVLVPDFTFNASASPVAFTGAKPVFVDIDEGNLNINVEKIEGAITKKTKAIMPVHIYGQAADMDPIIKIAKEFNLKVIEDAAETYGVFYKGKHTGTIGDVGIISFFADKTVTCGEGAVILTNDDELYDKLKYLRNQGRLESGIFTHPQLGMNFRMTDLQCAVGVAQLKKFKEIEKKKIKNYRLYQSLLKDLEEVSFIEEVNYSNFVPFRAPIRVKNLDKLTQYLEDNGIQTRGFFYPLHRQPCFDYLGCKENDYPVTNKVYSEGLCLPVFPSLKKEQIEYVCEKIRDFYGEKC